jgi:hypothetical protein
MQNSSKKISPHPTKKKKQELARREVIGCEYPGS